MMILLVMLVGTCSSVQYVKLEREWWGDVT